MKTLEEMRARIAEIEERFTAIDTEFRDASLDEERQAEWEALEVEYDGLKDAVAKAEARAERIAKLAQSGSVDKPGAPAYVKKHTEEDIYDVRSLRMDSYSEEDFEAKLQERALRAVDAAKFGVARNKQDEAQEYVSDLLETIDRPDILAKRMLATGSKAYEQAFGKLLRHGSDVMCTQEERMALVRAQALGTDNSGGYAVPFQLDPTVILTNAGNTNPIRELARVETITGKQWQGVTTAGVTVVRGSEGDTAPDNSFTLGQPTVSTNRVQGFVPFNIEIDLAWGALRTEITRLLVDSKAIEEDSFITGDGSTGVQPGGIKGSLSGTVTCGGVASFAAADIYALHAALDPRWERNATFLGHKAIYNKVRQFDTSGGAQLWAHIGDGRPNGLMGYPAVAASAMDSTLTTGKKILILGDFSQFLIVDRIGMNVELIPHLFDSANGNRPRGQRGVYAVWMNNSKVLVPGAFETLVTG